MTITSSTTITGKLLTIILSNRENEALSLVVTWKDKLGQPIDITNLTPRITLYDKANVNILTQAGVVLDGPGGQFKVVVPTSVTATWTEKVYTGSLGFLDASSQYFEYAKLLVKFG